jgi:IPT/TIG domain
LTHPGKSVLPSISAPIPLFIGNDGLDITQAPNGNLIETRYQNQTLWYHKPIEPVSDTMVVKTMYPRRGRGGGGNTLSLYGVNFNKQNRSSPVALVGNTNCLVISVSQTTRINCKLPGGAGTANILVKFGTETSLFERGYRYIPETLPKDFILPVYTG